VIRLATDRHVYVSYRFAGHIYWSRKKVTIHAGEALLSDGTHLARTRCGNRVSELPAKPVSPAEPEEKVMNNPMVPESTTQSVLPPGIWSASAEPLLPGPGSPVPLGPNPGPGPIPFPPCCAPPPQPGPKPPSPPIPPPQPGPPPLATPEPSSFLLVVLGFSAILTLAKIRRP